MVLEVTIRGFARLVVLETGGQRIHQPVVVLERIPCWRAEEWSRCRRRFLALAVTHQCGAHAEGMLWAYTVAIVVLCMQTSNQGMNRTARERRSRVPVTLRVPAAGYAQRWASE